MRDHFFPVPTGGGQTGSPVRACCIRWEATGIPARALSIARHLPQTCGTY